MKRQKIIKLLYGCLVTLLVCCFGNLTIAKEVRAFDAQNLYVKGLDVNVRILEDTSLEVEEKLLVNFPENYDKNSFDWNISKSYKTQEQNLRRNLKIISVQGVDGINYKYNTDQGLDSAKLQIRSDSKFTGEHAFKITYTLSKYIDEGVDYDKIVWPAIGDNSNLPIVYVNVIINSPFAEIVESECWAGDVKAGQRMCLREYEKNQARFYSTSNLGEGKDFIYLVGIRKNSELKYPSKFERFIQSINNNIEKILIVSLVITLLLAIMVWFFRKRKISIRIRKRI